MKVHGIALSDTGLKRAANQDFFYLQERDYLTTADHSFLFILADGMGGHAAGEIASRLAVTRAKTHVLGATVTRETKNPDEVIRNAFEQANDYIFSLAKEKEDCEGMGTTMVVGLVIGEDLYLGNVGDSRAYSVRGGALHQETRDHSLVAEQVRLGLLTREQAAHHPSKHLINRAVGVREFVKVDIFKVKLLPGDVILLCSDGLVDYASEDNFLPILAAIDEPIELRAKKLIDLANAGGGGDNITVILLQVTGDA